MPRRVGNDILSDAHTVRRWSIILLYIFSTRYCGRESGDAIDSARRYIRYNLDLKRTYLGMLQKRGQGHIQS